MNEVDAARVMALVAAAPAPEHALCAHGGLLTHCPQCKEIELEDDQAQVDAHELDRAGQHAAAAQLRHAAYRRLAHYTRRIEIETRARAQTTQRRPRARVARRAAARSARRTSSGADPDPEPPGPAVARPLLVLVHRGDARVDAFVVGGTDEDAEHIRRDVERAAADQGWHSLDPSLIGALVKGGAA